MDAELARPSGAAASVAPQDAAAGMPRLGFLGVGWIGRNRMEAVAASGAAVVAAVADPSAERAAQAAALTPGAASADSLDALLEMGLDGVVIATPSALHAEQSIRALERGLAVFCQKPLARTASEARQVIDAARAADRLLGVDMSYRHTAAMQAIRQVVRDGGIGEVFAADLVFHNTWGPDMGWARDASLSGGGCVIDLGTHLVDLALWVLDFPAVTGVSSQLFCRGRRLPPGAGECEDHATATLELEGGAVVRLACSWESSTGRDAVIEAAFHGTGGGAAMRNVNGSFHDFSAERFRGNSSQPLAAPPDAWGGRAIVEWSRRVAAGAGYNPEVEELEKVAAALDGVLGR
jgi:predicted dehydrogenase